MAFSKVICSNKKRFLRYHATFKVRNLSRCFTKLIHFCKKVPLALNCKQSRYSMYIYYIHIFSILRVAFVVFYLCYFPKLQLFVVKKFWHNFCCIVLMTQIFKILFQTEDINIFVSRGVFFSRYIQLKSSFSDYKDMSGKTYWKLSYRKLTWQNI